MSDAIAAPAAASAPAGTPTATDVKAPTAPTPLKIKGIEFKSEDDAYAEIERGRQSGKLLTEAEKRLRESTKRDKSWEEMVSEVKTKKDAKLIIKQLGLSKEEAADLFGKYLYENEVLPAEMSPEKRRIRELEAEKAEREALIEADKKTAKAREHEAQTQQEAAKLRKEIESVIASKKIPATRLALKRVANYLSSYAEAGVDIPMDRAVDLVAEDYKQEFGELFDDATPDQLMEFFGKQRWHKIGKKVSDWALAQARGKIPAPPPAHEQVTRQPALAKSTEGKLSPQDFMKVLKGVK